jgi:polyisoprenoid-binding protein YceI
MRGAGTGAGTMALDVAHSDAQRQSSGSAAGAKLIALASNSPEEHDMSTTTIQQIPTGTYSLDPVHSTFGFAITHNGVSKFRGQFERVDAQLQEGILTGTAQVDSVKTAIDDLKGHLLSPDFFDAANTPTIGFRSGELRVAEDGRVELDGELTIRGVTKPVSAAGSYAHGTGISGHEVVGLDLEATIDRRDYGLSWQAELPKGGEVLGWDVKLEVHLELQKA